jgi:nucleoside-diphosphate-sugar epimerase
MRVLILGGSGFVGSNIFKYLSSYYSVFTASRSGKNSDYILDFNNPSTYSVCDENYDIVVNCIVDYNAVFDQKINNDVFQKSCFLEYLSRNSSHFIDISSISALSQNKHLSDYNFVKFLSDEITSYICKKNNLKYTILRFAQIFDLEGKGRNTQRAFYYFVDTFKKKQILNVFGNADKKRSYMPIDILVKTVHKTIVDKITGEHSIIMADSYSANELINEFNKVINLPEENINYILNEFAVEYYIPRCSEAYSDFLSQYPNCSNFFAELLSPK